MKILFSGGGTLGPVTPLLAMKETFEMVDANMEYVWVGTEHGPEREFLHSSQIRFLSISSGKFRRYLSFQNFLDVFLIVKGFFESISLLKKEKPSVCISAGGFVSVPLHAAAWVLGIPCWVHAQDVKVGLANRLMGISAKVITVALSEGLNFFPKRKTIWIGNPVRKEILEGDKAFAKKFFEIKSDLPVVFCVGGGTGSATINALIVEALPHLRGICEVIHLYGERRNSSMAKKASEQYDFYHAFDFFGSEMKHAYAISDLVVCRGGLGTLSELAALQKGAIVVPKPGHQEENARYFERLGGLLTIDEKNDHGLILAKMIEDLLNDSVYVKQLGVSLHEAFPIPSVQKIFEIFSQLFEKKNS